MKKITDSGITDFLFVVFLLVSCNVIKAIPGNFNNSFTLNGRWKLESANTGKNLVGATIDVSAIASNAVVVDKSDPQDGIKPGQALWKQISADGSSISVQVLRPENRTAYMPATITVLNADQIKLAAGATDGTPLVQTWTRVIE
ncbi:MAG: hypothetical protein JO301_06350 [Chitinophagaceae bacterium]|nr:hypothetical protein [Chitinophagaceae bacterium]